MSGPLIRAARPEDAQCVVDLVNRVAEEDHTLGVDRFPLDAKGLAQFAATADPLVHLLLTAHIDDRVVGYLYASRGTTDSMKHVSSMAVVVDKEARRQGVGTALITAMRGWAQVVGVRKLTLSVLQTNMAGRALFECNGYYVEALRRAQYSIAGQDVDELFMAAWLAGGDGHA